jgi:hypothetical protein
MDINDLEKRVELLERVGAVRSDSDVAEMKTSLMESAKLDTLEAILEQIALRLGVSQSDYSSHYVAQYNRHLAKYLDAASQISEQLAAPLDGRELDEIDVGDAIPPLFPEQ